jgi:large subunit ribosomal protein L13
MSPEKKTTKKASTKAAENQVEATPAKAKAESKDFSNKTKFINENTAKRNWILIDAKDQTLGRLCGEIARILRGKRKSTFTPHADSGDFVVVINAKEIKYSGRKKGEQTAYYRYTGYPGGLRKETLAQLLKRIPERVIYNVVKGMLPKESTLSSKQLTKLKIYAGPKHPHAAQKPIQLETIPAV